MKNKKMQMLLLILGIVFIGGLTVVINSFDLGNSSARKFTGSGWSLSEHEANMKTISFMIAGVVTSLVSGVGLVGLAIKNVFDV